MSSFFVLDPRPQNVRYVQLVPQNVQNVQYIPYHVQARPQPTIQVVHVHVPAPEVPTYNLTNWDRLTKHKYIIQWSGMASSMIKYSKISGLICKVEAIDPKIVVMAYSASDAIIDAKNQLSTAIYKGIDSQRNFLTGEPVSEKHLSERGDFVIWKENYSYYQRIMDNEPSITRVAEE